MKTIKLLMLIWLLVGYWITPVATAQKKEGGQVWFQFKGIDRQSLFENDEMVGVHDNAVFEAFDYLKTNKDVRFNISLPASPVLLGVTFSGPTRYLRGGDVDVMSKKYMSYLIPDTTNATLIALGITKANCSNYRYRVVENDSVEIVHWSPIPSLQQNFGAKQPYGFIGKFKGGNKQLFIEVVNINKYSDREGVVLDWRVKKGPQIDQIVLVTPNPNKEKSHVFPDDKREQPSVFNINAVAVNKGMATKFDKDKNVPLDLHFSKDSVIDISIYLKNHSAVEYSIYFIKKVGSKPDTTNMSPTEISNIISFDGKLFEQAGSYEIIIQPAGRLGLGPKDQIIRIPFEVKPPPLTEKKVSIKQLIPYTIAILTGIAILFFVYRRQSRARVKRAERDKEMVGLKLRSIRAQLNPHFMFNALTSIQNLINKNNISGANYYLSTFAGLTRQVLDTSNEEMLSLEDELKLLGDYLQMEQLRFNFRYNITVDEQLDQPNIEIPAMLLQPFVENSIKHGVATLGDGGQINIAVSAESKDLLLSVIDNGVGFNENHNSGGYGIRLSKDRIALLNQIYKDQTVTLHISKQQPGTRILIRLPNWIS